MSEADQELKPHVNGQDSEHTEESSPALITKAPSIYKWWLLLIIYSFLVVFGGAVGTLLARLYFNNGGKSQWLETLVQVAGFPILIPFQCLTAAAKQQQKSPDLIYDDQAITTSKKRRPFYLSLASIYIATGILVAGVCMLFTIGLKYLPVTTYTIIGASQLAFNSLFSYILNGQKFTPYIVNSVVILTISSVLLAFQTEPGDSNKSTKEKYFVGFVCTLAASAGYALMLSVMQLAFQKIIKKETMRSILDMNVYQSIVATILIVAGIFASGDWKKYGREMDGYEAGKVSYVMNLFWTAVSWQVFSIGCVGLVFKFSSLFTNVIGILGLPVSPVLAVIFLGDKLTGLKAISLLLAMWGFVSYMYQHFLDDLEMKKKLKKDGNVDKEFLDEFRLANSK